MIPQRSPRFQHFSEAAKYFYGKFAESAPLRFERYLDASGGRELEAIAKYCWNIQISESLLPCLHTSELALRNGIHRAMCLKYLPIRGLEFPDGRPADDEWWFTLAVRGTDVLRDKDYERVRDAYFKVPQDGKPVTPRVVAELSFGFWVELLNSIYDESIVVPTLGSTMRKVQTKNPSNRKHGWLRERFGEIRDIRNRVSHLEPVYHLANLQFVHEMAWLLSTEITPALATVIHRSCRFNSIYSLGWKGIESDIRSRVKTELFQPFSIPPLP